MLPVTTSEVCSTQGYYKTVLLKPGLRQDEVDVVTVRSTGSGEYSQPRCDWWMDNVVVTCSGPEPCEYHRMHNLVY
jgi:hypothetical protein